MKMKLTASLLLLSVFSTAHAGKILERSGDWVAEDTSDRRNPNGVCRIYTDTEAGNTDYFLIISRAKNTPGPADIQLVMKNGRPAKNFTLTLKDETVLAFADAGPSATEKRQTSAWYIPQHTANLFAQLEDRKDLRIKPADGSRDPRIELSADGFKRVKEKLEEKCLNKEPLYDLAFEEAFFLKRDAINPLGITPDQVKELRRVVNAGYAIHLGINGTKSDLVKLQAKFQNQLNERDNLVSRIDSLGNREIPSIISEQQQNDGLEANSRGQLAQVNVTISQQQSSLNAAQAQLNTARTVIAPYEAEHADRESRAVSSRRSVNNAGQRLNEIDRSVSDSEQRINQLSNEAGVLQNQNARIEQDLHYARRNYAQAENDVQRFRPRDEVERRLRQNNGYQQSVRELARIQNELQIIRSGLNDAKGKLLARETELRVCQTRTSFLQKSFLERIPAQERRPRPDGDRPNRDRPNRPRPDGDNTPTTPTQPDPTPTPTTPTTPVEPTPTAPDCTSQQNAVNSAKQVVANLQTQENASEARYQDVNRDVQRIQNRTEEEARNIEQELRARARQAGAQVTNLESQRNSNINRVNQIAGIEIPREQSNINSLSNERPSVQARYDQEGPNASRLENELASFERRIGWDAKVEAVENAEVLVSQRSNDLNRSLSQKTGLESQINRCQQARTRLANDLVGAQNRKREAENRLQQVIASLVPFDQEKARLEQQENDLKGQLMSQAQDFEAKLP
jgi:hypothetical protein